MCNIVKRQGQTRLTTYSIENVGRKNEKYEVTSIAALLTASLAW